MSLEALYADRIEEALQRDLAAPPRPQPTSFRTWSMLSAGAKGLPRGGLEMGASLLEGLGATIGPLGDERNRNPAASMLASKVDELLSGTPLRAAAQGFAPPETAHMADQVANNLLRVGGKAGVALAASGGNPIIAGTAVAAEETNTAYRELLDKGIDPDTALKTAAVQGVATGASIALPVVGQTVKATAGLVLAGGPGTYMAQEKLMQQILAKAGYHDEASLHNPTDPLGLSMSLLLPGAIGAISHAVRPPSLSSVVEHLESKGKRYGPDGEILTSPKGAQGEMQVMPATSRDPGFGVTPARDGSPEELARVGRDYIAAMEKRYPGDPAKALAAYNAGPGAVDAAVAKAGDDWRTLMPAETRGYVAHGMNKLREDARAHVSQDPEVVDAARTRVTNDALNRSMPDHMDARSEVMRAGDEIAAGRMPQVEDLTYVYHGSPHEFDAFDLSKIGTGEGAASYGHGLYFADAEAVGARYRDALAPGKRANSLNDRMDLVRIDGKPVTDFNIDMNQEFIDAVKAGQDAARAHVDKRLGEWRALTEDKSYPFHDYAVEKVAGYNSLREEMKSHAVTYGGDGHLYKVAIPTRHIEKMLDWDKPVPADLRTRLATAMIDDPRMYAGLGHVRDGRDVYEGISAAMQLRGGEGSKAEVTAFLREQGVTGIRYLDQASRDAGHGSSNYVLFDDKITAIVERNGQPLPTHPEPKAEAVNELPPPEQVTIEPPKPEAKAEANPVDVKVALIGLRRRESVLNSLLECMS